MMERFNGLRLFNNRLAIDELKKNYFYVRVPTYALYEDWELEVLGLPTNITKDGYDTKSSFKETTVVYRNLYDILDFYKSGFTIYVPNQKDIVKIAEILDKLYIELDMSPHASTTELKDLIKDFLENVLSINRDYIDKEIQHEERQAQEEYLGIDIFTTKLDIQPLNTSGVVVDLDKGKRS